MVSPSAVRIEHLSDDQSELLQRCRFWSELTSIASSPCLWVVLFEWVSAVDCRSSARYRLTLLLSFEQRIDGLKSFFEPSGSDAASKEIATSRLASFKDLDWHLSFQPCSSESPSVSWTLVEHL